MEHPQAPRARHRHSMVPRLLLVTAVAAQISCADETLYDNDIPTAPGGSISRQTVAVSVSAADRMEATDPIVATVQARDGEGGGGVVRLGMTALLLGASGDTLHVESQIHELSEPETGLASRTFTFTPPNVGGESLPDTVRLEVYGHAVNVQGSCTASTLPDGQRLACREISGGGVVAASGGAPAQTIVVAAGRTFLIPGGGVIADALANVSGVQHLYLSNITNHTVEVLDLSTTTGGAAGSWTSVRVGSEPWGLTMHNSGNDLLVANSGGTSISYVPVGTLREDLSRRLETPNTPLFEVVIRTDTLGAQRYESYFYDFSDRPQFIAQDRTGLLLYSTVPTPAAGDGTIRYAVTQPGWVQPEVRILFPASAVNSSPNHWSIAHIDSLRVVATASRDLIMLYDHVSGFPSSRISAGPLPVEEAVAALRSAGSDVYAERGKWVIGEVGFSDTTFVAASSDRRFVAFGEGAVAPAGRILLWDANLFAVSNEISVADLVSNASERVSGVALNADGSIGVARGTGAAYFFGRDLRLRGMYREGLTGGAGGAAIVSTTGPLGFAGSDALAFVATPEHTIRILETSHYLPVGEITIRDTIVGPLRSSAPLPGDNAGLACPGSPECVAVKIYGVTSAGGVVVIDVRERDIVE